MLLTEDFHAVRAQDCTMRTWTGFLSGALDIDVRIY